LLSLKTVTSDFAEIFDRNIAIADVSKVEVELERRLALQNICSQEQPLQLPLSSWQAMYQSHPSLQDWDTKQLASLIVLTSSGIIRRISVRIIW